MRVISKQRSGTKRISTAENKKLGIISYDEDNAYPQRIMQVLNASPTGKACVETYSRFIGGEGFKDPVFYKTVVNSRRQTMDKILDLVKHDLARFRGFAIHFNVSADAKITGVHHVPFEQVRKLTDARRGETGFDYAIYRDWAKSEGKNIKEGEIHLINKLALDSAEILREIENAGSIELYKGQLLYFSMDEGSYPLASCDAVLEPMYAEIQSDISTTRNIETNFTAKGVFVHKGKFADDEAAEQFEDDLSNFIGPEGESLIVVDVDKDEEVPQYIKIDSNVDDKMFEYTDKKIREKIVLNWMLPKVLMSITDSGMFNQEQIRDATMYYNMLTVKERLALEETFKMIAENFEVDIRNANADYSIKPIEFKSDDKKIPAGVLDVIKDTTLTPQIKKNILMITYDYSLVDAEKLAPEIVEPSKDERLLIDIIGVGGTQALQAILSDTVMTPAQKKSALMIIFGLSDQDATALTTQALTA